jgi:trimethylamine--corrinoid protein Co-methyltransferase
MHTHLQPSLKIIDTDLGQAIIDESTEVLNTVGVFVENEDANQLLGDHGARVDRTTKRAYIPQALIESALLSAPHEVWMYDRNGQTSYHVGGDDIHFDPGSAALKIFDYALQEEREAAANDVVRFARLTGRLDHFHFQSTGLISRDVPEAIADSYRLFLGLLYCAKPIITGTFAIEGFSPMLEMLAAVRGGRDALREKPLAIFDACPSPPLKWSNLTAQSLIDCARSGIPSELVAMPLTGATAPVTLTGALVQLTAENLAGLVIAQCAHSGAPVIFGGSPSSFDMRTGSTPMGAMETMMIDCAYAQIGKMLGLPTHAYMGLSDAKCVDTQAGFETGMGAILAALAGINVISGGGMMNFESTQSLEKLVIDNEICGMSYRLLEGIRQREEVMALPLLSEVASGSDFLTNEHTRTWFRKEHIIATLVDRGNHQQWQSAGKPSLEDRAHDRVEALLTGSDEHSLELPLRTELHRIMQVHASRAGCQELPSLP